MSESPPSQKTVQNKQNQSAYSISSRTDILGKLVDSTRAFWLQLGKLESLIKRNEFEKRPIKAPLYICGLSRSGISILTDLLYKTERFATHRVKDYPFVDLPLLSASDKLEDTLPLERASGDGLFITKNSPEMLEEMLWTPFFPHLHNPSQNNILNASTTQPAFETYYQNTIRKILRQQRKNRYLSKNHYTITRIRYLTKIFPDARFVILVRHPGPHIASLVKQHKQTLSWEHNNPRIAGFLQKTAHYDFGAKRRAPNLGQVDISSKIRTCWKEGDHVKGYALLWNQMYRYIYTDLLQDPALQKNLIVMRYEDLCRSADTELRRLFRTLHLEPEEHEVLALAEALKAPDYYRSGFNDEERQTIKETTQETCAFYYGENQ